jgi:hypothetical protein
MNGTGVLKVYLIQQKKYAYRLKFQQARASQWVMDGLNSKSKDAKIGFEDTQEVIHEGVKFIKAVPNEGMQL